MADEEPASISRATTARADTTSSSVDTPDMPATNGVSPTGGFHHLEPQHPCHDRLSTDQCPSTTIDGSAAVGYDGGAAVEQVLSRRTQSRPLNNRSSSWILDDYFVRCHPSPFESVNQGRMAVIIIALDPLFLLPPTSSTSQQNINKIP